MLTLHGFALSNYYNKVKFALLEKGLPFAEVYAPVFSRDPELIRLSPLGKVPFLSTGEGPLAESQVILDYLERLAPTPPLLPPGAYQAAKVHEVIALMETYTELTAREMYGECFFGAPRMDDAARASVEKRLKRCLAALAAVLTLKPYAVGDSFTMADCAAFVHLPLIALASKLAFGRDMVLEAGIDWKAYTAFIGQRPAAQNVAADRKAYQDAQKAK